MEFKNFCWPHYQRQKETNGIIFNIFLFLTQYINVLLCQHVINTKIINEIFYVSCNKSSNFCFAVITNHPFGLASAQEPHVASG